MFVLVSGQPAKGMVHLENQREGNNLSSPSGMKNKAGMMRMIMSNFSKLLALLFNPNLSKKCFVPLNVRMNPFLTTIYITQSVLYCIRE